VDNGWVRFKSVHTPREFMLSRFASVSRDGVYSTLIPDPTARCRVLSLFQHYYTVNLQDLVRQFLIQEEN
jgi:hypothetical protein